ncbi:MAG: inositol monophosphatase family protein [Gammaproteobacteria bacterium]
MLPNIQEVVHLITEAAQQELRPRFNSVRQQVKHDGSILTEADSAMDRRLQQELIQRWPSIRLLSEEMSADEQAVLLRDRRSPIWCVDPLDGTSNFAAGLPFYAVSLGLIMNGELAMGWVYDPEREECFSALRGGGAWLNGSPLVAKRRVVPLRRAVALVDFKRLPPKLGSILACNPPYGSQRNLGACALEWGWIAAGRGHLYLHGGQKLWDRAAGTLILSEAGGYASTLEEGSLLEPTLESTAVVASSDPDLFAEWRDWVTWAWREAKQP